MIPARPLRLMAPLLAALLAAGCASAPRVSSEASPGADFSAYRTYAFHTPLAAEFQGYSTPDSERMKAAARQQMDARGYTYSESAPDLLVNLDAQLQDRADVLDAPQLQQRIYFSSFDRGYVTSTYWVQRNHVHRYVEGTLNVDLVDAKAKRLVWEGTAVGRMRNAKPEERGPLMDQAMVEIFAQYPHQAAP
jgi:hypothetical protein